MNCREAESQIFAERDGALDNSQRAALAQHVGQCPGCRRLQQGFAVTIETWRVETQQVRVPDAELEWQKLRREIRGGAGSRAAAESKRRSLGWFSVPLAAAAAVALIFVLNTESPEPTRDVAKVTPTARADSPTVVVTDEKSGWTFVVAADDMHRG